MRLGQLARHLETTPKEIVAYFASKGVDINSHPNSKLSEDQEKEVSEAFGFGISEVEIIEEATHNEVVTKPEIVASEPEVAAIASTDFPESSSETEEEINDSEEIQKPIVLSEAESEHSEPEIIKAPKIALPGLKVVGKIDLPEPKKPEPKKETESAEEKEAETTDGPKVIRHHRRNGRKRLTEEEREARRLKNKRAKEKRLKREAEKRKQLEEMQVKELKTQHYQQKITKPTPAPKKTKKKAATQTELKDTRPKPKTILGKFWRWLNTWNNYMK